MFNIDRRKALTVVAAVPAAAVAAVVPALLAITADESELIRLGRQCLELAREGARLHELSQKAWDQTDEAFAKLSPRPERWFFSAYSFVGELRQAPDGHWRGDGLLSTLLTMRQQSVICRDVGSTSRLNPKSRPSVRQRRSIANWTKTSLSSTGKRESPSIVKPISKRGAEFTKSSDEQ